MADHILDLNLILGIQFCKLSQPIMARRHCMNFTLFSTIFKKVPINFDNNSKLYTVCTNYTYENRFIDKVLVVKCTSSAVTELNNRCR